MVEIAVVALGPDVRVGRRVDQLHGHVNIVGRALNGAFQDAVDVEFAGNVGQGPFCAFVLHDARAGDDAQVAILGEGGDEFVGHAVGEVVLGGVTGEVG